MLHRRLLAFGALPVVAALALTACGGSSDEGGAGTDTTAAGDSGNGGGGGSGVTLEAKEFRFDPSEFTAPADEEFTVTVKNAGAVEHDFTLDEADLTVLAKAGETKSATFELAAGSYTFYCSVPGHRQAGMEGKLTVE